MPTSDIQDVYRTRFEETHWSVILRAKNLDESGAVALEKLCRTYRLPLYSFVRHQGYSAADADDLVQSFFLTLLEHNRLNMVDPSKGKFRSFLLRSLKNFLLNDWDSRRALKRGGAYKFVSLHDPALEMLYSSLSASKDDSDKVFDRTWALAAVRQAMSQLQEEYDMEGRGSLFLALKSCLSSSGRTFEYSNVSAELGMREENVRMAVNRMRRRFREVLRQQVKNKLANPNEIDEELRYLLSCL